MLFKTPRLAEMRCGAGGTFMKRIIGLPGETVRETEGRIYINEKQLSEPYVPPERRDHNPSQTFHVPKNHYFMIGDNRQQSCDSRVWGSVPRTNIEGKVVKIERPS